MSWETEHSTFYTEARNQKGYDIIHIDSRYNHYSLYLSYKDYEVCPCGEYPKYISRDEFDKLTVSYKKYESFDLSSYDPDNYERFYRSSRDGSDNIDLIEFHSVKKEYALFLGVDEMYTDGFDLLGNNIYSTYVSDTVFDAILEGARLVGFKKVDNIDDEIKEIGI